MSESIEKIKNLVDTCSEEDKKALKDYLGRLLPHPLEAQWEIDADTILSAIGRSSDLTKRGMRGIIAEAVFVNEILPTATELGWLPVEIGGDHPYDALLGKGQLSARIQVKLQRLEKGIPKLYYPRFYKEGSFFVVEVQKTRTGVRKARKGIPATNETVSMIEAVTVKTRPYSFGDFDILAVSMQPSARDWRSFRYTVASWLLPRDHDEKLIETFQPVAAVPNDVWTDDLRTCLDWFESGQEAQVLTELVHLKKPKNK